MSTFLTAIHGGAITAGSACILYVGILTTAALTALLARNPGRRRDAQQVLKIMIRLLDRRR